MRRLAAALAITLALVAVAAPGSGAQGKVKIVFTGGFVYHSEVIPAGATVSFKVTCPAGYFATAGTVSSGNPKVLAVGSVKAGGGKSWSFGFRNTDSNSITIVVVVSCNKPPPLFAGAIVPGISPKKLIKTVVPGKNIKVTVPCPAGETPVGDSEKSLPSGGKRAFASSLAGIGGLEIASIVPGPRDISIELANPGTSTERVRLAAICMPKSARAGGERGSVQFQRASFNANVKPGGTVVSGACPGGLPLMAGFSLPAGSPVGFLGAGFSKGRFSASWALSNSTQEPGPAKVNLLCVPGRVKFVKGAAAAGGSIDTEVGPITVVG